MVKSLVTDDNSSMRSNIRHILFDLKERDVELYYFP